MFCHNCGTHLEDNYGFCPECGAKQDLPEEWEEVFEEPVEKCYEEPVEDDFEVDQYDEEDQKRSKRDRKILLFVGLVILVLVIGVGGFLLYRTISSQTVTGNEQEEVDLEAAEATEETEEIEEVVEDTSEEETDLQEETDDAEEEEAQIIGHEYEVITGLKTWQEAKEYCEAQGGHLATVASKEEYEEILSYADASGVKVLWLGASRTSETEDYNRFTWVTGETWNYDGWASGEPNNDGGEENYLGIMCVNNVWSMYDLPMDLSPYYSESTVGFILERDITE